MATSPAPPGPDPARYFFLSYARTHSARQDPLVLAFYNDICEHIMNLTDHPANVEVGFIDRDLKAGRNWLNGILSAIATCRVFLPLYTKRYFTRKACGEEWHAFSLRERHNGLGPDSLTHAIIPLLWTPVDIGSLPPAVGDVQMFDPKVGPEYARFGLYGLAAMGGRRDQYDAATYLIALEIVDIATNTRLAPCKKELFDPLENVFDASRKGKPPPGGHAV